MSKGVTNRTSMLCEDLTCVQQLSVYLLIGWIKENIVFPKSTSFTNTEKMNGKKKFLQTGKKEKKKKINFIKSK